MAFKGWPAEALDFYEGLEADNTKTYWNEHKAFYDEQVKGPMVALLDELAPEFGDEGVEPTQARAPDQQHVVQSKISVLQGQDTRRSGPAP